MSKTDKKWVMSLDLNEQTLPTIEQITEGMPGGFFIYYADENEEFIYNNQAMVNMFGCDSQEDFIQYIGNSFHGVVHPEDLEQVEKSIYAQIARSSKGLDYVEYRIMRKDGAIRWIRDYGRFVHTSSYGDVFFVFIEDATERHLRELSDARAVHMAQERLAVLRQLENETAALRMVHEIFSASVWSIKFDDLGKVAAINWSNEFRHMLGYHDEEDFPNLLESWSDLLHEDDKEQVMTKFYETINDYTGQRALSVQYRLLTKDRGWRWFQSVGKLFRQEDGTPTNYVGIFVDITRQKLTDEALQTQRKLLEDALKQAQQANKARNIFLNNMSHNLRTPMNAITGFTTLAKMNLGDKAAAEEYLDQVMTAADNLQTLIVNLLNASHLESGDISVIEIPCALPDILWDLEAAVRAEAKARQLRLSVGSEGLLHGNVICDRQQLNQALMNIVGNALKFTPPGGEINITLTENQGAPAGYGFYTFCIRDTGIGIDQEMLEHVFEPQNREEGATLGGSQGMGMGLAITKNIVEKMGGAIRVESENGQGAQFVISIKFRLIG